MTSVERREARFIRRKQKRESRRDKFLAGYDDFSLVTDPNNLYQAFMKSKKGVGWKTSIQRYEMNILRNIAETVKMLESGVSVARGFMEFDLTERGKTRHIRSVHVSERVVQKCLCDRVLVPMLSRFLIYDNGASMKGKGVHFSARRLTTHMAKYFRKNGTNDGYCLQIDFSKYFDRIVHRHLFDMIGKHVRDERVLRLLHDFVDPFGNGVSLGLGSQVSQIAALFYANAVDQFIKNTLRIKSYGRYMDDLFLILPDKRDLKSVLEKIIRECGRLRIKINTRKTRITKLGDGVLYLKGIYTLTPSGRIVRVATGDSKRRMRRKLFKFRKLVMDGKMSASDAYASYQSWRGNQRKRFDSFYLVDRMDGLYNGLFINNRMEERYG